MKKQPDLQTITSEWSCYDPEGLPPDGTAIGNEAVIVEYLDWQIHSRGRVPRTMEAYGHTLTAWAEWVWPQSLFTVTVTQMEGFLVRPRYGGRATGQVGAPGTQRRDSAILRSFYLWAWEKDHTPTHMAKALHSPKVHNIDPKPIPDEHFLAMWMHERRTASDLAAMGLAYYCGLRRQEILDLKVGNVTPTNIVDFRRKGGMNVTLPWAELVNVHLAKLPHLVPDPQRLGRALAQLVEHRGADEPLLCWSSFNGAMFNKRMKTWANQSGTPQYSPHRLRHSCATNLIRAGVPLPIVARMLNHSSVQTTMRYIQAGGRELSEWLSHQGAKPSGTQIA